MALSAFADKSSAPSDRDLDQVLGPTAALWRDLVVRVQREHGPLVERWHFSGPSFGWSMRLHEKKRVLVYLTPCDRHFLASFVLGDKACRAAHAAPLRADVLALIDAAKKYAEGRGIRVPVKTRKDVDAVVALAAIKAAN